MSSEKNANLAREQYSDTLLDMGVHAISVDEIEHEGENTFAVIAFAEKQPENVPEFLTVKKGKKSYDVPLKIEIAEKFKPE